MDRDSRRTFLSRLLAGGGATVAWNAFPAFAAAHEHAAVQRKSPEAKLIFFTTDEAAEMEAICQQIIPSDDGPGAKEAGALFFIDYALSQTEPDLQPVFRNGLKDLAQKSAPHKFSSLSAEQQRSLLKQIDTTEFFERARQYTILGFLGTPARHGNRNEVGWKYIGFENPGMFSPPFGYYDAELLGKKKGS